MIDPSNKDLVRLDGHTFITFNRETATLTCEHCRATETGVEQMQIISFAQAHRPCPHNATPDQQKAAQQRARALGFRAVVRDELGLVLTDSDRALLGAVS